MNDEITPLGMDPSKSIMEFHEWEAHLKKMVMETFGITAEQLNSFEERRTPAWITPFKPYITECVKHHTLANFYTGITIVLPYGMYTMEQLNFSALQSQGVKDVKIERRGNKLFDSFDVWTSWKIELTFNKPIFIHGNR